MGNNNLNKNKQFALGEYKSLAPDYFDDYQKNSELLTTIIKSGTATNVGIVSKFGGGKSSFIKTFIKNNRSVKTANVSVANIVGDAFNDEKTESIIIKQLIYSKKSSDLPDSRIKRIGQRPNLCKYLLSSIFIALSAIAFALFSIFVVQPIESNVLCIWFGGNGFNFLLAESLILLSGILFISIGISILLFNIKSFSLKFKDLEITKTNIDEETPFFKYLDELVYFFNKTKTRIVFFEDLDRAKEYLIFDKLRELNSILNSSIDDKQNNKIVFVYACADEVFKSKPEIKNKYFDFVFNLDPVLTKENCASVILNNEIFAPLKTWLDDPLFVDRISIYFEEMRVLLSVYNDCLIYVKNLNNLKLESANPIEIFTLMTYRAIFPSEFQKLVEGEGALDKVIESIKMSFKTSKPFDYLAADISILKNHIPDGRHRDFVTMSIKYGYLTADFKDYILRTPASDSLSLDELEFLRNLNSNKYDKGSFFRKFDNMDRLYSKLGDNDFKDVHILNKNIIDDYVNNKLSSDNDANIQQAFLSKKKEDIDYVNDFIINYLQGDIEETKEAGDKNNKAFFIKLSKSKTDLLKIILDTEKIEKNFKKELITDYIFALATNSAEFTRQVKFEEGIRFVENHKRFRENLIFYDWTLQYFDKDFEKIEISKTQSNDSLIKNLTLKNYVVLDAQSIHLILNAYGQSNNNYLKGHCVFNVQPTIPLFNFFDKNKESYFDILLENKSNQVGINSLCSYCNSNIKNSLIDQLLRKREKSAIKLDLNANLSPTAIISGLVNEVFKQFNLSLFSTTLDASVTRFKDDIVSSKLINDFLLLDSFDNSIKAYALQKVLNESNCTDDILKEIASLNLSLDNAYVKSLLALTNDNDLKVAVIYFCAEDKKSSLLDTIPELNNKYKDLVEKRKIRITEEELEQLPGINKVKEILNLNIKKNKENRIIRF